MKQSKFLSKFSNPMLRQSDLVADEAARLIYDEGIHDYAKAKLKASRLIGHGSGQSQLPSNQSIHLALHRLIAESAGEEHQKNLSRLRQLALDSMIFFKPFKPALIGACADGTAGPHAGVTLLLRAETVEEVIIFMADHDIPHRSHECLMHFAHQKSHMPSLQFYAGETAVECVVVDSFMSIKGLLGSHGEKETILALDELEALVKGG